MDLVCNSCFVTCGFEDLKLFGYVNLYCECACEHI